MSCPATPLAFRERMIDLALPRHADREQVRRLIGALRACVGSIWVKGFDPEELCLMEDNRIIELYNIRDERAIAETAAAYGNYCTAVAKRIVLNDEDAQECINDTYRLPDLDPGQVPG